MKISTMQKLLSLDDASNQLIPQLIASGCEKMTEHSQVAEILKRQTHPLVPELLANWETLTEKYAEAITLYEQVKTTPGHFCMVFTPNDPSVNLPLPRVSTSGHGFLGRPVFTDEEENFVPSSMPQNSQ